MIKNKKSKLKAGDKVTRIVGCSFSWNDQGVILKITKKKWLPYSKPELVATIKTIAGDIDQEPIENLEKI